MLNELLNDKFQGSLTIEQLRFGMRHDLQRRYSTAIGGLHDTQI